VTAARHGILRCDAEAGTARRDFRKWLGRQSASIVDTSIVSLLCGILDRSTVGLRLIFRKPRRAAPASSRCAGGMAGRCQLEKPLPRQPSRTRDSNYETPAGRPDALSQAREGGAECVLVNSSAGPQSIYPECRTKARQRMCPIISYSAGRAIHQNTRRIALARSGYSRTVRWIERATPSCPSS
jgi:hypothetical protein